MQLPLLAERSRNREIEGSPIDFDERRDSIVLDDDRIPQPLDERPGEVRIDVGDEPKPHRREARAQHGNANDPKPVAELASSATEDLGIRQHLRTTDLEGFSGRFGDVEDANEVAHHVADGDRLTERVHPLRRDHDRKSVREPADHLEARAPRTDDDRRPERRQVVRTRRQQSFDLPSGAEMFGEFVPILTEPAEIDDTGDPGRRRRVGEVVGTAAIPLLEARPALHRVDEIVGNVDRGTVELEGSRERRRIEQIPLDDSEILGR